MVTYSYIARASNIKYVLNVLWKEYHINNNIKIIIIIYWILLYIDIVLYISVIQNPCTWINIKM